jgi:hypothetical protein
MLNSPLTKDLIVGAIIESGVYDPRDPYAATDAENYRNVSVAPETGTIYMESLNASKITELRTLSFDDLIVSFRGNSSFGAVLDYFAITYMTSLLAGSANNVPVLTGNTPDESETSYNYSTTVDVHLEDLQTQYENWTEQFLALYPAKNALKPASLSMLTIEIRLSLGPGKILRGREQYCLYLCLGLRSSWIRLGRLPRVGDQLRSQQPVWDGQTVDFR